MGIKTIFSELINEMEMGFHRWEDFQKVTRPAFHTNCWVMEVMPCADNIYFSNKTVNGHPENPKYGKLCVAATGSIHDMKTGYPLMISEMTFLTALRTGATSALSSKYLARKNSSTICIIWCWGQSEFQILAHATLFDIREVRCYDTDVMAMKKFTKNLSKENFSIIECSSAMECAKNADIIITVTADKKRAIVLQESWVQLGTHICGLWGDCPWKTELEESLVRNAKIVVEYLEQAQIEWEIQIFGDKASDFVFAQLAEIIQGGKKWRENDNEITLFDGVGFALEDYVVLNYINILTEKLWFYENLEMIPELTDCKDLFGYFSL